jgi:undecaprenyl-diphosphatase
MGGIIVEWILKLLVDRPRPFPGSGASFPSGGALYWATWLGALAVVVHRRMRPGIVRTALLAALVAVIALGGIAWLAVGAHWLTDVIGAWCWAAAWVLWLHNATKQVT